MRRMQDPGGAAAAAAAAAVVVDDAVKALRFAGLLDGYLWCWGVYTRLLYAIFSPPQRFSLITYTEAAAAAAAAAIAAAVLLLLLRVQQVLGEYQRKK